MLRMLFGVRWKWVLLIEHLGTISARTKNGWAGLTSTKGIRWIFLESIVVLRLVNQHFVHVSCNDGRGIVLFLEVSSVKHGAMQ